jgi:predicted CXXCH cytochrome family protein
MGHDLIPARTTRRRWRALAVALLVGAAASPAGAGAKGGAFRDSPHGRRDSGVQRVPGQRRGACAQCHGSPRDAAGGRVEGGRGHTKLFAPNDNGLCFTCHKAGLAVGTFLGEQQYAQSSHGRSPSATWPGPSPRPRPADDAGKCVNCHDPHGVKDAAGLVPDLLKVRGAALCLGCHGGNPAPDVAAAFQKTYRHPLVADGAVALTSGVPGGAGATCGACHNPHAASSDPVRPRPPEAARALLGVARARVANGAAGSPPLQRLAPASDTAVVREYEICFKCHSGGAGRPPRGSDVAAALNPANASFHPVEAQGRNPGIDRRAFAQGWSAERLVACSDCHASDDGLVRGPHGSSYPRLLKKRHVTGPGAQHALESDLCFDCHAYGTYGDALGGAGGTFSRFAGHASHVAKGYSCWACHESHGSATLPALLALRSPGLIAFTQAPDGGSCTVSCHVTAPATASYRSAYPR